MCVCVYVCVCVCACVCVDVCYLALLGTCPAYPGLISPPCLLTTFLADLPLITTTTTDTTGLVLYSVFIIV